MKASFPFFAGLLVILTACQKEKIYVHDHDKLTRLFVTQPFNSTIATTDSSTIFFGYLTDFSLTDYEGVDSVKLVISNISTYNFEIYKLYLNDQTNSGSIIKSKIRLFANSSGGVTAYSTNIKNYLPAGRVNLGVEEVGGGFFSFAYLYLYRH